MPIQHKTSEQKWQIFLEAIGAKQIKVENVTDNKVIIKVNSENLEHLRMLLDDKEVLKKNILHALFKDSPNNDYQDLELALSVLNIAETKAGELFYSLVDGNLINRLNLDKILNQMKLEAELDEKLLTTQFKFSFGDPLEQNLNETQLKMLQATITDENNLIKVLKHEIEPIKSYNYPPTEFSQLISKISSVKDDNSLVFTLNNGLIMQALQDKGVPVIASDLKNGFIIDKQYLLPIFNGLVWSEEGKFPIIFAPKSQEISSQETQHTISLLIDISGSMEKDFNIYKNNILKILDKLNQILNWQIDVIPFNGESTKESFSSQENNIEDIKKYISSLSATGCTKLYGTIQEALESFKEKIDIYSTLIVFTDGKNEGTGCNITEKEVIDSANIAIKNPQFNMYSIGFGQYYNKEFFEKIAKQGGFTHVSLKNPEGMQQLEQYIGNIGQKISILEIFEKEFKLVTRTPAGDIFVGDKTDINEETEFYINGQQFRVGVEEIQDVKTTGEINYSETV